MRCRDGVESGDSDTDDRVSETFGQLQQLLSTFPVRHWWAVNYQAIAAGSRRVMVATGHVVDEIRDAVAGIPVAIVYEASTRRDDRIRAALPVIPEDFAGMLTHLAGMPVFREAQLASMLD